MVTSVLGPGASESAYEPFRRYFLVHYIALDLMNMSPIGLKSQIFYSFIFQVQVLKEEGADMRYEHFAPQGEASVV